MLSIAGWTINFSFALLNFNIFFHFFHSWGKERGEEGRIGRIWWRYGLWTVRLRLKIKIHFTIKIKNVKITSLLSFSIITTSGIFRPLQEKVSHHPLKKTPMEFFLFDLLYQENFKTVWLGIYLRNFHWKFSVLGGLVTLLLKN